MQILGCCWFFFQTNCYGFEVSILPGLNVNVGLTTVVSVLSFCSQAKGEGGDPIWPLLMMHWVSPYSDWPDMFMSVYDWNGFFLTKWNTCQPFSDHFDRTIPFSNFHLTSSHIKRASPCFLLKLWHKVVGRIISADKDLYWIVKCHILVVVAFNISTCLVFHNVSSHSVWIVKQINSCH